MGKEMPYRRLSEGSCDTLMWVRQNRLSNGYEKWRIIQGEVVRPYRVVVIRTDHPAVLFTLIQFDCHYREEDWGGHQLSIDYRLVNDSKNKWSTPCF